MIHRTQETFEGIHKDATVTRKACAEGGGALQLLGRLVEDVPAEPREAAVG